MDYVTERGTFESLQILRAAYIKAPDRYKYRLLPESDAWDKTVLHASDVGDCPRATMYRLLGTPEKPRSKQAAANRTVMLERGTAFHWLTYSALNWAGILVGHEIPAAPREGWAGSMDALIRPHFEEDLAIKFDEKTVLPNMLNYHRHETPKRPNCLQVAGYGKTQGQGLSLIEYADRAGSNDPEECWFDSGEWELEADDIMDGLEFDRSLLPELPPTLEQVYVAHRSAGQLDSITLETPWFCGYCDYHLTQKEKRTNPASGRQKEYGWTQADSTCKPVNLPPVTVAEVKSGRWTFKDDSESILQFLDSQVKTLPIGGQDE